MESVNAAIIYYSSTGTVHALARAAAEGAEKAGAQVRLRKVAETVPEAVINTRPGWAEHLRDTADVAEAVLAGKVYSAFTSSNTAHGGQESTLLALGNTFYHWGGVIVPPGYTDPVQFKSGNPYGSSHVAGDGAPSDVILDAVRHQARRAVDVAGALEVGWHRAADQDSWLDASMEA